MNTGRVSKPGAREPAAAGTLAALATLYLAQGLPFGFQAHGLRGYLTESGMDLKKVGLAGALAMPWTLKLLWAPLVDRYGSRRVGRRKSWIIPLQVLLALACATVAMTPPSQGLTPLLVLILLMNLLAATQDIAVDGLAIDLLKPHQLGRGNAAQVVGFKVGMLIAGGWLLWASPWIGWSGMFFVMSALVLAALGATLMLREPESAGDGDERAAEGSPGSLRGVLRSLLEALKVPGAGWLLLFVGTYKLGESMVDAMFIPYLIGSGYTMSDIGKWIGTYGMVASIAGSLAGGELARRMPLLGAVGLAAVLRAAALSGPWYLASLGGKPPAAGVLTVSILEHFFGGALTTAMFAFMMSRVRRSVGATHYTLLAGVETLGKTPGMLSGYVVAALGYRGLFALGVALSVAFLGLLLPLRERPSRDAISSQARRSYAGRGPG
ncbi:MFS transporter [Chondromyces crocatus]|uniref:MFS transporter n=1 Tax=Chondromyces crocatus TaxID=52 RepID=UPI001FE21235|nr:MFS transporter [Chondromyces crocatus]